MASKAAVGALHVRVWRRPLEEAEEVPRALQATVVLQRAWRAFRQWKSLEFANPALSLSSKSSSLRQAVQLPVGVQKEGAGCEAPVGCGQPVETISADGGASARWQQGPSTEHYGRSRHNSGRR